MPDHPELPTIAAAPLSVLLPAYNQEAGLALVVEGWIAQLDTLNRDYEIIFVDDGSTDRTAEQADALAARFPRVRVLRQTAPQGLGAALRTALAAAQFPLVLFAECTDAYQPADLKPMLEMIDHVHVVCGHRVWRKPDRLSWKEYRYLWLVRLFFGVRVKDVNCALKLFRRALFARMPIQSNGSFVHAELIAKANFLGGYLGDVAVQFQPGGLAPPKVHPEPRFWRTEALRVFQRPDFGPAILPDGIDPLR
jgi:glycosyltransferase involved in cell wall biosynthesis